MTGLVGVAVFDVRSFQCWNPDFLADRLIVSPRLVGVWIVENCFILFSGEILLVEQRFFGLWLKRDFPFPRFGFGVFQLSSNISASYKYPIVLKIDILPVKRDQFGSSKP